MVLSKREKLIAITLAGSLGLLLADRWLLTPYMEERDRVSSQNELAAAELERAEQLLFNQTRVQRTWHELTEAGLETDTAAAESKALHAIRDYSQNARVELQSLKTDRASRTGEFLQLRLQATGSGNIASIARFLRQVETTKMPLRVTEFRANARKDGVDDITFSLSLAALVHSPLPQSQQPAKPSPRSTR